MFSLNITASILFELYPVWYNFSDETMNYTHTDIILNIFAKFVPEKV